MNYTKLNNNYALGGESLQKLRKNLLIEYSMLATKFLKFLLLNTYSIR